MEETKNITISLGGLFDGEVSKNDPYIKGIKRQFLKNPNKLIKTDKPDEWYLSDIFIDYQHKNRNPKKYSENIDRYYEKYYDDIYDEICYRESKYEIINLSWIQNPETFKFYYNLNKSKIINEMIVYALHFELYDIADECYKVLGEVKFFRVNIKVKNVKNFIEKLSKYVDNVEEVINTLCYWNTDLLDAFSNKCLLNYGANNFWFTRGIHFIMSGNGEQAVYHGYSCDAMDEDRTIPLKALLRFTPIIRKDETIIMDMPTFIVVLYDNSKYDSTHDLIKLLSIIKSPKMFVSIYKKMQDREEFLEKVQSIIDEYPKLKINQSVKKIVNKLMSILNL